MITDFDKILNELSYRVKDGTPDLTNEQHLIKLFDVLKEHKWPIDSRVELIRNLTEAGEKHFAPQKTLPYIEGIGYGSKKEALRTLELVDSRSDKKDIIETLMNRAEFHKEQTQGMKDAHKVFKNYLTPNIVEKVGNTSATTFYHEVITGIIVGGGGTKFDTGEDVKKYFDDKKIIAVNSGLSEIKPKGQKWERFLSEASIPKAAVVSDAKATAQSIIKELGGKGKKMMWTGPTNDGSKYGAADIAGTFPGYGDVGISLKMGPGQLKNLTLGTFTKALGVKELKASGFVKQYKSNFDGMTKDWAKLITKLFNSQAKDSNAKRIFKKHMKVTWDSYQKEKISQEELDILTDAVGLGKIVQKESKTKTFKYFCRKMQYKFHPMWKEWQSARSRHFKNIFENYFGTQDNSIRLGLHNLFKKQLSVGDKSIFYAAKKGTTFWFIPSAELYNKKMKPEKFVADYELKESKAGYKFFLDVAHEDTIATDGPIGTIIIEIRFAGGQMDGTPDVKSSYKLVQKDWSGLLGAFRR